VLRLMIHSLYSNKEIFLRELVSNASDACDRLRFEALKDEALYESDSQLRIEIEFDPDQRLLIVRDNGIGMDQDEVLENIGTIARSGTRAFLEKLTGDAEQDARLIGQFGVGFYSSFVVAEKVELLTRKAGAANSEGVRWVSDGGGEFSIEKTGRPTRGTEVRLTLKESETSFLSHWTLKSLISRYSDHIGIPIMMRSEAQTGEESDDKAEPEDWVTVNQATALWTLPKSEIEDNDYQAFYKHISHDMEDPLAWAHNRVEGTQSYTTLLYLPSQAPFDLMLQRDERSGLRLYVRRVFIMDAAQQLLPHYLRFIRGVVDSDDLPLNVSRELLQENELLGKIRSAVVRRSLDLVTKFEKDEEKYARFWKQFGSVLKEGIVEDMPNRERIAPLLRFATTHGEGADQTVSLADYMARMRDGQEAIYYITAENHNAAAGSPQLEIFRKNGIEVLLMSDRIDEWMMGYFHEYEGKRLQSVAKGDIDLSGIAGVEQHDDAKLDDEHRDALNRIKEVIGEQVSAVNLSTRLTDSASCLVLSEDQMALHMQRLLEQAGQEVPASLPALELNPSHPLVAQLLSAGDDEPIDEMATLVYEQAVLAEGGQLEDPAGFVRRINALLFSDSAQDFGEKDKAEE
jgi:molecular chaperone HtpG